jgi:hypothetical protein
MYMSVTVNDIVIAYVGESACKVPASDGLYIIILAFWRGRAVYDDFVDSSAAFLQPQWYELGECCGTHNAVILQAVLTLELSDGFFG